MAQGSAPRLMRDEGGGRSTERSHERATFQHTGVSASRTWLLEAVWVGGLRVGLVDSDDRLESTARTCTLAYSSCTHTPLAHHPRQKADVNQNMVGELVYHSSFPSFEKREDSKDE